jgi:hypothetical protein
VTVTDIARASRPIQRAWYRRAPKTDIANSNVIDMRRDTSLVASSSLISSKALTGVAHKKSEAWMTEAWTMYDLVGELHFLATTLSRRAAGVRFYVGRIDGSDVVELDKPEDGTPRPVEGTLAAIEEKVRWVFSSLGDGFIGLQDIVGRAFLNQFIVGSCYLVGAPPGTWAGEAPVAIGDVKLDELEWRSLSVTEFYETEGGFELRHTGSAARIRQSQKFPANALYVISLWSPHPADASVPDSPVRATLPILRELVGLTQHVSAQIDSRLAGAGMLVMRSSASRAIKRSMNIPEDDPRDPFTELLIEAMVTPISDRDSASAVVPYVVTIPDDAGKPEFISFSTPLDAQASKLRTEAIDRLAMSLDAPPELLRGQTFANHWSAWLNQREVVEAHLSPTLALICRAITTEFLRAILRGNGLTVLQAEAFAIWFDTSGIIAQANQAADAQALFKLGILSEETTRRASGFDDSDAPKKDDVREQAIDLVKTMVTTNPGLMNRPGLDVMVKQIEALLSGTPQSGMAASQDAQASSGSTQIGPPPGSAPVGAPKPPPTAVGVGVSATPASAPAASGGGPPQTRVPAAAGGVETFGTWEQ